MVFTGAYPDYSVEDYPNAVTANLILNIGPEPVNTPPHQNWIQRRTDVIKLHLTALPNFFFSFPYRSKIRLEKTHTRILQNV